MREPAAGSGVALPPAADFSGLIIYTHGHRPTVAIGAMKYLLAGGTGLLGGRWMCLTHPASHNIHGAFASESP